MQAITLPIAPTGMLMNGLEMISQLREAEFSGKIIILSGYSDFEYARQALRLNVYDYLSKPSKRTHVEQSRELSGGCAQRSSGEGFIPQLIIGHLQECNRRYVR